jgi:hypothetical protein
MHEIKLTMPSLKEFMDVMKTDFKNILKTEMESCGYTVDANTNFMDLCISYCTLRARRVQTQVRNVHTPKNFVVPPELQVGFNLLHSKFKQGVNVNPHLSRSIKYSDCLEDLLFFRLGDNTLSSRNFHRSRWLYCTYKAFIVCDCNTDRCLFY